MQARPGFMQAGRAGTLRNNADYCIFQRVDSDGNLHFNPEVE